jgi:hypothetical protein
MQLLRRHMNLRGKERARAKWTFLKSVTLREARAVTEGSNVALTTDDRTNCQQTHDKSVSYGR